MQAVSQWTSIISSFRAGREDKVMNGRIPIPEVSPLIRKYVEENILPVYDGYDKAHSRSHILSVIRQSMDLYRRLSAGQMDGGRRYDLDPDMIYVIAAYHDIGICEGRESHHLSSGRMLEEDVRLKQWFTAEQIQVMRKAVEDHRSSSKSWPRSIYGRIVSEADKVIDLDTVFSRAILYAKARHPELPDEEIFRISYGHLRDKYGDGGYMRLQFPDSPNALRLGQLREKLRDPELMRREFSLFEVHPLEPFMPEGARVLLLGSFPPPKARWSMDFFYPNFQNDMWRIMGLLFFGDREHFVVKGQKRFDYGSVTDFCGKEGIALYDAAYMVKRLKGNASDNFLKIIEPTDIRALLTAMPSCTAVASTGGKSAEQIASILGVAVPPVGGSTGLVLPDGRPLAFHRMPSSSRAYPLSLEAKAEIYSKFLESTGFRF